MCYNNVMNNKTTPTLTTAAETLGLDIWESPDGQIERIYLNTAADKRKVFIYEENGALAMTYTHGGKIVVDDWVSNLIKKRTAKQLTWLDDAGDRAIDMLAEIYNNG